MSRQNQKKPARSLFWGSLGPYYLKWSFYFVVIGLAAGAGALIFDFLCHAGVRFFLDGMAGWRPPVPAGEVSGFAPSQTPFSRWILLLLPAMGGLISGFLVFKFAPESEGHGTDAAIAAYHYKGGSIRARVPVIKTLASAITLTTGGSGGREGPIALIGAGIGSFLGTRLKLTERERRIMLAAGIAAGVGSIFRAPLAGALFAAEVLYRDPEIESDVVIPAGLASVVAYCLFCLVTGNWGSLFAAPHFTFSNPLELGPYLALAIVVVGGGFLYVRCFYGVISIFAKLKISNYLKPAIGGLLTGIIGFFLPEALSFGYGFVQQALFNETTILFLLLLAGGKILTTSFSIGSGGSGGVFGPSIVIGGALGGAVGLTFAALLPNVVTQPGAFVVVGMAGFFTGVSNAPISTIIFVSEMTGSYHLLLPSLLVCSVSYLFSRRWTIFAKQPKNRLASPAHAGDFFVDILQAARVRDLMDRVKKYPLINEQMPFGEFKNLFVKTSQHYFPVVDEKGRFSGIFSSTDIRRVLFEKDMESLVLVRDIATRDIIFVTPHDDLASVMQKFTIKNLDMLPVVRADDFGILIGMLSRRDVIAHYNSLVAGFSRDKNQNSVKI